MLKRMWRRGNSHTPLVGVSITAATTESNVRTPLKTTTITATGCSDPTTTCIPQRQEIMISKRHLHHHVNCSTIHNSQDIRSKRASIITRMDKENVAWRIWHNRMSKMGGTGERYVNWNKPGTKRQILHAFPHMWELKIIQYKHRMVIIRGWKG